LLIAAAVSLLMTSGLLIAFRLLVATLTTLLMILLRMLSTIGVPDLLMPARLLVAAVATFSVDIVALLVLAYRLFTPELPRLQVTSRCRIASRLLVSTVVALAIPGMALLILVCAMLAPILLLRMRLGDIATAATRQVRILGRAGRVLRVGLPRGLVGEGVEDFPGTGGLSVRPTGAAGAAAARACGELSGEFAKKSRHGLYCQAGCRLFMNK